MPVLPQVHTIVPHEQGAQLLLLGHRRIQQNGLVRAAVLLSCAAMLLLRASMLLPTLCSFHMFRSLQIWRACLPACLFAPTACCCRLPQVERDPLKVSITHLKELVGGTARVAVPLCTALYRPARHCRLCHVLATPECCRRGAHRFQA